MEKKLTAQGPLGRQSFTVTLPLHWVKEQNLDSTKVVDLEVVGNKIVIAAHKRSSSITSIKGENYPDTTAKVLQGLYRLGVNDIHISYIDSNQLEQISKITHERMIGCEIIEQNSKFCVIKDVTRELEEGFDTIMRRIFLLILELTKTEDKKEIDTFHKNISRLANYCQRILIKKGHMNHTKTPFYYLVVDRLEKIKDELVWLKCIPITTSKQKAYTKDITMSLRKSYELYCRFNAHDFDIYANKMYHLKQKIRYLPSVTPFEMHIHNLARLLNSIYSNIGTLKH